MSEVIDRPIVLLGDEPQPRPMIENPTPRDLVRTALAAGADLAQVAQYMQLQRDWEADQRDREAHDAHKAFNKAFAAFKAEAIVIIKNKTVGAGPLVGSKYAELFAVVNAVTPALSLHGLSTSWKLTKDDKDWMEVTCTLKHADGHSESVSMGGPPDTGGAKSALQARASTKTFLERYTLKAILGVAEQGDDTDGNSIKIAGADDALLQAGRDASMEGVAALTAWWGKLNAKERSALQKDFAGWRRAAAAVDQGAAHE